MRTYIILLGVAGLVAFDGYVLCTSMTPPHLPPPEDGRDPEQENLLHRAKIKFS